MSEQKPEAVWVFPEEPKKRGGRIALIIGLVVAVLAVVAFVAVFLIPRGEDAPGATPTPSQSPSPSPTASRTATPKPSTSATPTASPTGAPTTEPAAPQTAPPPVPDPSVAEFRGQVQPRLDDAATGFDMLRNQNGDAAVQIVDSLQNDAQNLAGQPAPTSIGSQWGDAVNSYAAKLQTLRTAYAGGSAPSATLDDAVSALGQLRSLVGL